MRQCGGWLVRTRWISVAQWAAVRLVGFEGDAGDVGRKDAVGCAEQGAADGGFLFEDVDGGGGNGSLR